MSKDEARNKLSQSLASSSARYVLEHWLARTEPATALALAKASFSDNETYLRLKRELGYV
jgi:hypothetical protein